MTLQPKTVNVFVAVVFAITHLAINNASLRIIAVTTFVVVIIATAAATVGARRWGSQLSVGRGGGEGGCIKGFVLKILLVVVANILHTHRIYIHGGVVWILTSPSFIRLARVALPTSLQILVLLVAIVGIGERG